MSSRRCSSVNRLIDERATGAQSVPPVSSPLAPAVPNAAIALTSDCACKPSTNGGDLGQAAGLLGGEFAEPGGDVLPLGVGLRGDWRVHGGITS